LDRSCDDVPPAFNEIHTKSLAALIFFSVGVDYLDREKYDQARDAFQKSLEKDPSFGLAQQSLLETPVPGMQFAAGSEGTADGMISMAASNGVSATAAGTAIAVGSPLSPEVSDGVGIAPVAGIVAGAAALAGVAVAAGGSSSSSSSGSSDGVSSNDPPPQSPQDWTSWSVPSDPAPYEGVTVWVDVNAAEVTVTYEVIGTDGYTDSGSLGSDSSGRISFYIPGGAANVRDTVTVKVPQWGPSYVRTFEYVF
jgi:hypothetical protein